MMPEGGPIRVLLADDHTMFRQGLKEMLAIGNGIEVVGEAENGEEAVTLARKLKPDVVVLDVEMPVMGAAEAMEGLRGISPRPKVLIVTMYDNPRMVRDLLSRGASAYLVKSASLEELLAAVRATAASQAGTEDGRHIILAVPRSTLERVEKGSEDEPSEREMEILLGAARGYSNRQIATSLSISEATVKRHLANVYSKIGVGSRGEAVRKALTRGWITAHDVTGRDARSPSKHPGGP
jgi:DNA-binding NarL/FixJ family response regulator